jgi:plasmid replication initiation protein
METGIDWLDKKAQEASEKLVQKKRGNELSGASEGTVHYSNSGDVNMSKVLAKAAHGLSLSQKRLIMYAVSRLDSISEQPQQIITRISAKEYAKAMGIEPCNAYRDLQDAADKLFGRYISLAYDTPKGREIEKVHWVSSAKYQMGEGWVELRFTPELSPYITKLTQGNYISYKLQKAIGLRSHYSWRLLELLMQWPDTKRLFITLEDFRHALEIPEKYLYADIRVHCIEKSVKELKKRVNLDINWKPIKEGRAVKSLQFSWKENEQLPLDLKEGGDKPRKRKPKKAK